MNHNKHDKGNVLDKRRRFQTGLAVAACSVVAFFSSLGSAHAGETAEIPTDRGIPAAAAEQAAAPVSVSAQEAPAPVETPAAPAPETPAPAAAPAEVTSTPVAVAPAAAETSAPQTADLGTRDLTPAEQAVDKTDTVEQAAVKDANGTNNRGNPNATVSDTVHNSTTGKGDITPPPTPPTPPEKEKPHTPPSEEHRTPGKTGLPETGDKFPLKEALLGLGAGIAGLTAIGGTRKKYLEAVAVREYGGSIEDLNKRKAAVEAKYQWQK